MAGEQEGDNDVGSSPLRVVDVRDRDAQQAVHQAMHLGLGLVLVNLGPGTTWPLWLQPVLAASLQQLRSGADVSVTTRRGTLLCRHTFRLFMVLQRDAGSVPPWASALTHQVCFAVPLEAARVDAAMAVFEALHGFSSGGGAQEGQGATPEPTMASPPPLAATPRDTKTTEDSEVAAPATPKTPRSPHPTRKLQSTKRKPLLRVETASPTLLTEGIEEAHDMAGVAHTKFQGGGADVTFMRHLFGRLQEEVSRERGIRENILRVAVSAPVEQFENDTPLRLTLLTEALSNCKHEVNALRQSLATAYDKAGLVALGAKQTTASPTAYTPAASTKHATIRRSATAGNLGSAVQAMYSRSDAVLFLVCGAAAVHRFAMQLQQLNARYQWSLAWVVHQTVAATATTLGTQDASARWTPSGGSKFVAESPSPSPASTPTAAATEAKPEAPTATALSLQAVGLMLSTLAPREQRQVVETVLAAVVGNMARCVDSEHRGVVLALACAVVTTFVATYQESSAVNSISTDGLMPPACVTLFVKVRVNGSVGYSQALTRQRRCFCVYRVRCPQSYARSCVAPRAQPACKRNPKPPLMAQVQRHILTCHYGWGPIHWMRWRIWSWRGQQCSMASAPPCRETLAHGRAASRAWRLPAVLVRQLTCHWHRW